MAQKKNDTNEPERLDLRSHDVAEDKRLELLRLFPEVKTEGGKIDFDRLKRALGETVDAGKERYGMTWPGKAECFKTIQAPSLGTLRPCPEESVNFDSTENLIIEGDNLEVLILLQKSYLGKVKMIYIDPPYNTGNDFIYPDNFTESLQTYLEYTGQVDAEGKKFGTNTEADGRFHSKWLNMMYPRLYLARNLLREDGIVFVSIDDHEVQNLRRLCDEIFGEESFLATIIWQKKYSTKADSKHFSESHEYVLSYARNVTAVNILGLGRTENQEEIYQNPDNDPRGPWASDNLLRTEVRDYAIYEIVGPTGTPFLPPKGSSWRFNQDKMMALIAERRIWFGKNGDAKPRLKRFRAEVRERIPPQTFWGFDQVGHTDEGTKELAELLGDTESPLPSPKPSRLIRRMLQLSTAADDLVLDFFAGSGTTGHAALDLNLHDAADRNFILIQLPEPTNRRDYPTIAEITKERVCGVIKKLNDEDARKLEIVREKQDRGFRVFKLAESNFKPWNAQVPRETEELKKQLDLHVEHILKDRSAQDILYEILLKSGYPLTTPVETRSIAGKTVHSVASGLLLVCLDRDLTLELIRAMAELKPERVVCLDAGFAGNDQLKANAVQIFKTKGITSFKTV
jgi:adenine-specific DNA-methyltransferase